MDLAFKYFTSLTLTVRLAGLSQITVSYKLGTAKVLFASNCNKDTHVQVQVGQTVNDDGGNDDLYDSSVTFLFCMKVHEWKSTGSIVFLAVHPNVKVVYETSKFIFCMFYFLKITVEKCPAGFFPM